ncbi:hypothetical protein GIB67_022917 [Kingdonia uniflora]|uniref:Geranylgeranyl transferase type-2 subunit beta n=1 Tax=Kingdonia uniflora TaxID=39325 RepID=A0A7J7LIG0_9MAGN|nr:hypothetical protein GIB67_023406 [Kingdonia uniflora]KAF6173507.1 hypothetical protein GIB67_022917 [Kingdonia uniflora]
MDFSMGHLEEEKHAQYILSIEKKKGDFESVAMEHLRMNGAYWGLTTLDILGKLGAVDIDEVVSWVMQCQNKSGGFGGNIGHDPHLLYTLSAVQILALLDKLDVLDVDNLSNCILQFAQELDLGESMCYAAKISFCHFPDVPLGLFEGICAGKLAYRSNVTFPCINNASFFSQQNNTSFAFTLGYELVLTYKSDVAGLQSEDGSFSGDIWGEVDTRFSYIAVSCLSLLHCLDKINVAKAVNYIVSCQNSDGGFGCTPGGESHAGQVFCCVGALAITGSLHHVDKDLLGWWLCERQVKTGGLNGRPEKLPDVRYIVNEYYSRDKENGGISDRPDDAVDIYHTYFGVAGLSLLEYPGLKAIDPAYALPVDVVTRILFHNKGSSV